MAQNDTYTIEGADIMFRNFAGRERDYNAEGDRNFCVMLDDRAANELRADGWNVKELKPREEGDSPRPYLTVSVNYKKGRPPRVVMITSRGRTDLGADEVEILDYAELDNVDLILSGYRWDVNGNQGVKAYLKSMFVTMHEDALDLKYAQVPETHETAKNDDPPWNTED